ncbi:putative dsRNA-binding protein [Bacillus paranthracis]
MIPSYKTIKEEGPDNNKRFTIKLECGDKSTIAVSSSKKKSGKISSTSIYTRTKYKN